MNNKPVTGVDSVSRPAVHLTPMQAWEKVKPYCAYQERCHSEVRDKLYGYGLNRSEVEQTISRLIEENYLNEERFAVSYAGGHARIKKWGKIKITYALKQKGVSAYCIKQALKQIDSNDYYDGLKKLAENKWQLLRREALIKRRGKCRQFLLQRGFEPGLVAEVLQLVEAEE